MGKKTDEIRDLRNTLAACGVVLSRVLHKLQLPFEYPDHESATRIADSIDRAIDALRPRRGESGATPGDPRVVGRRPPGETREQYDQRTGTTRHTVPAAAGPWHTFDDEVDAEIARLAERGELAPRPSPPAAGQTEMSQDQPAGGGTLPRVASGTALAVRETDATPDTIRAWVERIGELVGAWDDDTAQMLQSIHGEILRVTGARSPESAAPVESLAEVVGAGRDENIHLREEFTKARTIIGRVAAAMQIGEVDPDGVLLLEKVQRWESAKVLLKRRVTELERQNLPRMADELKVHLASLISSKEFNDWMKAKPKVDQAKLLSTDALEIAQAPDLGRFHAIRREDVQRVCEILDSENIGRRDAHPFDVFEAMLKSQTATQEFIKATNLLVIPILARLERAQGGTLSEERSTPVETPAARRRVETQALPHQRTGPAAAGTDSYPSDQPRGGGDISRFNEPSAEVSATPSHNTQTNSPAGEALSSCPFQITSPHIHAALDGLKGRAVRSIAWNADNARGPLAVLGIALDGGARLIVHTTDVQLCADVGEPAYIRVYGSSANQQFEQGNR